MTRSMWTHPVRVLLPALTVLVAGCVGGSLYDDTPEDSGVSQLDSGSGDGTAGDGANDGANDGAGDGANDGANDGAGDGANDGASDGADDAEAGPPPGITVTPTTGLITTEAGGTATFTIVLNARPTTDVTIPLSSSKPLEGVPTPASVKFTTANWDTPQTVTVTGVDDTVVDGSQAYTIVTGNASSNDARYTGMVVDDVSLTNEDDDKAGIIVTPTTGLVTTEAGGTATFTVHLGSKPTGNVVIALTSSKPLEGLPSPTTLTFTPSSYASSQTVTVTGQNDFIADGNQPYFIVTAPATSSDSVYSGLDADDVAVNNTDDETPGVTVTPQTGLNTNEGGGTATFVVVLNSKPTANVTIGLSSDDTGEGTVLPGSVTFTPDNWNAPVTVTVTGVDDTIVDGPQTYKIVTTATTSADVRYQGLEVPDVTVTNADLDVAGITVTPVSGLTTTETGGTATFTVRLNTRPAGDVTIGLSSSRPLEGTVSPADLTFDQTNWDQPKTVTVKGVDDLFDDKDQTWFARTAPAVSTDPLYNGRDAADVEVLNIDNDAAGVTVSKTTLTTTESGGTDTFTVQLNSAPTSNVTITVRTSDNGEGLVGVGAAPTFGNSVDLVFTPSDFGPRTVTVKGVDDLVADGNQVYTIFTDAPATTDLEYLAVVVPDLAATNQDNDSAGILVTATSVPVLTTTENGGTATFSVTLQSKPTVPVTVTVVSQNGAEGTVSPAFLTFTPTDYADPTAHVVTVTGADDALDDGDKSYTVLLTGTTAEYAAVTKTVTLTNTDDDVAALVVTAIGSPTNTTTESGNTATYSVALATMPSGNVTVTIVSNDVTEGSVGSTTLTFTPANWNVAQPLVVTGVNDAILDLDVAYTVTLTAAGGGYAGVTSTLNLANLDNEGAPAIVVEPTTGLSTSERGISDSFNISLTHKPYGTVTITLGNNAPGEIALDTTTVVLTVDNWELGVDVSVTGVNDNFASTTNSNFTVVTNAATSPDLRFNGINPSDVSGTNYDYNAYVILVRTLSGKGFLQTTEAGGTGQFRVFLNAPPVAPVTVPLSVSKPNVATISSTSVTIPVASFSTGVIVTATGLGNGNDSGGRFERYVIQTGAASTTDPDYNGQNPADLRARNLKVAGF